MHAEAFRTPTSPHAPPHAAPTDDSEVDLTPVIHEALGLLGSSPRRGGNGMNTAGLSSRVRAHASLATLSVSPRDGRTSVPSSNASPTSPKSIGPTVLGRRASGMSTKSSKDGEHGLSRQLSGPKGGAGSKEDAVTLPDIRSKRSPTGAVPRKARVSDANAQEAEGDAGEKAGWWSVPRSTGTQGTS